MDTFNLYSDIVQNIINLNLNKVEAKNKLSDILEKYRIKIVTNDPNKYDLSINIDKFLADKKREGLSLITISSYKQQLNIFNKYINKKIQEITKEDILNYFDIRKEKGALTINSLDTIRSVLRTFFEWLKEEEMINESPLSRIKPFKTKKTIANPLSIEELERVRYTANTLREKALLELLYSTGCRLSEIQRINIKDIDWSNRMIKVLGKGNKERIVFFSPRCALHLQNYLNSRDDNEEALFITMRKPYRRLSKRGIQRDVTKIGEKTSVHLYPHRMRTSLATIMLNRGAELAVVQELLGHEDINTTKIYTKVSTSYKKQTYEKYLHH